MVDNKRIEREYIERKALIAKYDRVHQGPAGGARKLMVEAPTADVVEVRHGEWIKITSYPMGHKCSECGYFKIYKKPYCEICGAKMDGGEGE